MVGLGFVAFLSVPLFSLSLSLRNHAPWNRRELVRPPHLSTSSSTLIRVRAVPPRGDLVHRLGDEPFHGHALPQPERHLRRRGRARGRLRRQHLRPLLQRQRVRRHGASPLARSLASTMFNKALLFATVLIATVSGLIINTP